MKWLKSWDYDRPKTKGQKRKELNKKIEAIKWNKLQNWIDEASNICPEIAASLEGIYCGHEGKIHEPLHGEYEGLYLAMGWYTVYREPKVEYAYVS